MKKGIRGHDVTVSGLDNICKRCENKQIRYLQLILEKSVNGFKAGYYTESYAKSLKSMLGNIKIAILGSYINPSNPVKAELEIDLAKFKEKIKYASVLNPIAVGTETGIYIDGKTDSEEAYQYLLGNIRKIVSCAEEYSVTVAVEGVHCFVINTPQKLARLIEDVDSDNIKVIFDPVNYLNIENYAMQDEIISDAFKLLGDKMVVLHAKDFCIENDKLFPQMPGEGMLNYKLIFEKIKEYNLDIPIICEEIDEEKATFAFEKLEKIQGEIW